MPSTAHELGQGGTGRRGPGKPGVAQVVDGKFGRPTWLRAFSHSRKKLRGWIGVPLAVANSQAVGPGPTNEPRCSWTTSAMFGGMSMTGTRPPSWAL